MLELIIINREKSNEHILINVRRKKGELDNNFIERGVKKYFGRGFNYFPEAGNKNYGTIIFETKRGLFNCVIKIKAITE